MLFYTGITRSANTILAEQNENNRHRKPQLNQLRDLAGFAAERLSDGDVDAIGPALRESWEAKRKLASGVSTEQIDTAVTLALEAGATGVKLTTGRRRWLPPSHLPDEAPVSSAREPQGMKELPVKLDRLGTRVVLNVARDIWS